MTEQAKFEEWAIVDVMGHQRYVGLVTEQVIAGQGFVRVDIPESSEVPGWTKLVGTSSIYAITPISEEIARGMASERREKPVQPYDLPKISESPQSAYPPPCDDDYDPFNPD